MPNNMQDIRGALSNHELSDGSVEVEPFLKALEAEQIDSLGVLSLCFPTEQDVTDFARKNALNIDQFDWLMKVRGFSTSIAQALIEEVVAKRLNARVKREIDESQRFVTSSDDTGMIRSSDSNKMRRLESAASKRLLGNTGPTPAAIKLEHVEEISLQSLNEKRRQTVIFACNKLLSRLGGASVRYAKVFGPNNLVKCVSMMDMMIEAYFSIAGVECVGN